MNIFKKAKPSNPECELCGTKYETFDVGFGYLCEHCIHRGIFYSAYKATGKEISLTPPPPMPSKRIRM